MPTSQTSQETDLPEGWVVNTILGIPMPDRKSREYTETCRKIHDFDDGDPKGPYVDDRAYAPSLREGQPHPPQQTDCEHLKSLLHHLRGTGGGLGHPGLAREPMFVLGREAVEERSKRVLRADSETSFRVPLSEEVPSSQMFGRDSVVYDKPDMEPAREMSPEASPLVLKEKRSSLRLRERQELQMITEPGANGLGGVTDSVHEEATKKSAIKKEPVEASPLVLEEKRLLRPRRKVRFVEQDFGGTDGAHEEASSVPKQEPLDITSNEQGTDKDIVPISDNSAEEEEIVAPKPRLSATALKRKHRPSLRPRAGN